MLWFSKYGPENDRLANIHPSMALQLLPGLGIPHKEK
jgi:hypothetical protein